ncbi:MAG: hypothetical protein LBQ64_01890, partial [Bacteroidales bacterium]|jgi:hypothetical protein|nr:hypothetical protein [Bacteroidales bacterium]
MRKIGIKTVILLLTAITFCRCEPVKELVNMLNCTFERKNLDNFRFAGVGLDKLSSPTDLNLTDLAKVTAALVSQTAPVSFNINLEGKNPNSEPAAIEQLKWILLLDGKEVVNGNITNRFSIPAKGSNVLPLEMNFDAMQYLDGSTPESVFQLYRRLTGKNAEGESNLTLKIKPTINGIEFPQYLTLKQTIE